MGIKIGFSDKSDFLSHFIYVFCHGNIFHLAVNLLILWSIRNKMQPISAYIISVLVSFIPMHYASATVGMSGFIFAVFGLMWGRVGFRKELITKVLPIIIVSMLIPNVNGLIHFYAFAFSFIYSWLYTKLS